ncbi:uncharacterized protein LOC134722413 [Mytilus trossulus]|uniref:uncharacterized protein LOC134722413 n=1 Tax=Mytilus trossulus TaxID=6551 RepID=UPI003005177B
MSAVSLQVGARLLHYHSQWFQTTQDKLVLQIVKNGFILDSSFYRSKRDSCTQSRYKKIFYIRRGKLFVRKTCYRACPDKCRKSGLLQNNIHGTKKTRRSQTNSKFKTTKPVCHTSSLQNGNPPIDSKKSENWGLGSKTGFARCLFPYSHSQTLQKISTLQHFGKKYQYRALPFGLRSAPMIFTKVMAVVGAFLRKQMIHIFMYLVDWMLKNSSKVKLTKQLQYTQELLKNLGLIINVKKSCLVPTQTIEYLGAVIHLKEGLVFPSLERLKNISQMIQIFLNSQTVEARVMLRLLG